MITNPDWREAKARPYLHQLSLGCIEEIAAYIEDNDIEEMDCDTCLVMQEILSDEIEDEEFFDFAIDNLSEMMEYIAQGNLNIRMHRNITAPPKDASGKPARPARLRHSGGRAVWRACPTISVADEM